MIVTIMKKALLTLLIITLSTPVFSTFAFSYDGYWQGLSDKIAFVLTDAENIYRSGNVKRAKKAVQHAYFGIFESFKMESAMRKEIGARHAYKVERKFGEMRKAMQKGASPEDVHIIAEELRRVLHDDARVLDDAGIPKNVYSVNQ